MVEEKNEPERRYEKLLVEKDNLTIYAVGYHEEIMKIYSQLPQINVAKSSQINEEESTELRKTLKDKFTLKFPD
ncbi:MAG: hypothetical protein WC812_01550 [Candidatus Pacearchaeota archaeon]|jgi:hypothetical protein